MNAEPKTAVFAIAHPRPRSATMLECYAPLGRTATMAGPLVADAVRDFTRKMR